jgi:V/A-type H+-transporting ATPase subunit C
VSILLENILNPYDAPFWVLVASILVVVIGLIFRPFITHIRFTYPNALFEAIGNPYLEDKQLGNIVESKDLNTFKETLNSSKNYNIEGDDTYTVQKSLDENFFQTVKMMRKNSPKQMNDFYNVYLEKYDTYLVKNVLKRKLENKETSIDETYIDQAILPGTKDLLQKLTNSEKTDIPNMLKEYGFEKEIIELFSEENVDFLTLDAAFDKHVINSLKQVTVPHKCDQVKQQFMKILTDVLNIKNMLRAKHLGYDKESCKKIFLGEGREISTWKFNEMTEAENVLDVISNLEGFSHHNALKNSVEQYNKEDSVQSLENALDGYFIKIAADISVQNILNIGPTLRFLISKEFEIKNLKIIAKGVDENLSSDITKSYLIKEVSK